MWAGLLLIDSEHSRDRTLAFFTQHTARWPGPAGMWWRGNPSAASGPSYCYVSVTDDTFDRIPTDTRVSSSGLSPLFSLSWPTAYFFLLSLFPLHATTFMDSVCQPGFLSKSSQHPMGIPLRVLQLTPQRPFLTLAQPWCQCFSGGRFSTSGSIQQYDKMKKPQCIFLEHQFFSCKL